MLIAAWSPVSAFALPPHVEKATVIALPAHVNTATALRAVVVTKTPQTKPKKKKKVQLARSGAVLDCAVLCIDAGETSGPAALDRANLRCFGRSTCSRRPKSALTFPSCPVRMCSSSSAVQVRSPTTARTADAICFRSRAAWLQHAHRGVSRRDGGRVARQRLGLCKRDKARERELEMGRTGNRPRLSRSGRRSDAAGAIMMGPWLCGRECCVFCRRSAAIEAALPSNSNCALRRKRAANDARRAPLLPASLASIGMASTSAAAIACSSPSARSSHSAPPVSARCASSCACASVPCERRSARAAANTAPSASARAVGRTATVTS